MVLAELSIRRYKLDYGLRMLTNGFSETLTLTLALTSYPTLCSRPLLQIILSVLATDKNPNPKP